MTLLVQMVKSALAACGRRLKAAWAGVDDLGPAGAALAGIAGPLVFALGVVAGQELWRTYNPVNDYMSELAVGPYGWLQDAVFMISGSLIAAFGIGLRRHLSAGRYGRYGAAAIVVSGLSLALLGLFVTNVPGHYGSPAGFIHARLFELCEAASIAAIAFLYLHFRRDPVWGRMARYALATGGALLVVMAADWVHATDGWRGIQQRLVALVLFVWLEALAIKLWRLARREVRRA
jgi:hypothetical membrane protein